MGIVLASKIINDARGTLNDPLGTRWPDAVMLSDLNAGQLAIVTIKENAYEITVPMIMVAGTRQSIPADGIAFAAVDRNTNGSAVKITSKDELDSFEPNWHTEAGAVQVINYCTSGKGDEKNFYVTPPSDGTGSIDVRYQAIPASIAAVINAITLGDEYENVLRDYILYRAYAVDTEVGSAQKAQSYYQLFMTGLGQQVQSNASLSPNRNAPPVRS